MPKFRKLPVVVEATQWLKKGDHPLDYVGMLRLSPASHAEIDAIINKGTTP